MRERIKKIFFFCLSEFSEGMRMYYGVYVVLQDLIEGILFRISVRNFTGNFIEFCIF